MAHPRIKVFLVTGYFDHATPFAASNSALRRAPLAKGRLTTAVFETGHSIFSDPAARAGALERLRMFYRSSAGENDLNVAKAGQQG